MKKSILVIGAYERDNFGDFLFFYILKCLFADGSYNLTLSSVIKSDMREVFGEYVNSYHSLLLKNKWDIIWIAGGEIGSVKISDALNMSLRLEHPYLRSFRGGLTRRLIEIYLVGKIVRHLAYLPSLLEYKKNRTAKFIINSVGGFEMLEKEKDVALFEVTKKTLKDADVISVRNKQTKEYLDSLGIDSLLAPDVVHALPLYCKIGQQSPSEEEYILFQASKYYLDGYAIGDIVKNLADLIKKYECKIFLFAAGIASHHDDFEKYNLIKDLLKQQYCEERVDVIYERDPLVLVNWIKHSKLWIGTSLHGRVVSIAYSVPRISLRMDKVSRYAELWDEKFPFDVDLGGILDACDEAFSVEKIYMDNLGQSLANKAKENIERILKRI